MRQFQMNAGKWFDRWGLTYTYGTSAVLEGFYNLGESVDREFLQDVASYLTTAQLDDGGWGKGFATYYNVEAVENPKSTIEQTGWSLLGLMTADQQDPVVSTISNNGSQLSFSFAKFGNLQVNSVVTGAVLFLVL